MRRKPRAGPDLSTLRRNMRAPMTRMSATHSACQAMASRCGQAAAFSAATAIITSGEERGKAAANRASGLLRSPTAVAAAGTFPVAGGLVARGAFRLTLVTRGLDPKALSVPEVGFAELGRDAYDAGLRAYAEGGAAGIAAWIDHCAEAVVLGAREGTAICESMQR